MFQLALTERNIQFQVNLVSFSWSWIAEISARWIVFRFFYLTQPLQPQTEMVYNLCKKYGFLSINSTKNGCFVSRNKKDIILSAFLEEKRDSSLLRPQRLLRLWRPLRLKMLLRSKNHLLHLLKAFFIFFWGQRDNLDHWSHWGYDGWWGHWG